MIPDSGPQPGISIEMNAAMAALLAEHAGASQIFVPSPFRLLVFGGLKEVDGCVFFRELYSSNDVNEAALAAFQDRTGLECAMNKIHLEDYLEKGMAREAPSLSLIAVECAKFLAAQLRKKSPDYPFRIIASVDDRVCTLRFHKVREGELWFKDIHAFTEAVLVLDLAG